MNFDGWVGNARNPSPKFFIILVVESSRLRLFLMNLYGFFNIHYVEFLFLNIMFNSNMLKINKKDFVQKESIMKSTHRMLKSV